MRRVYINQKNRCFNLLIWLVLGFFVSVGVNAQILRKTIKPIDVSKRDFFAIANSANGLYQLNQVLSKNAGKINLELRIWDNVYWKTIDKIEVDSGAQIKEMKVLGKEKVFIVGKFSFVDPNSSVVYKNIIVYNGKWEIIKGTDVADNDDYISSINFYDDSAYIGGRFKSFAGVLCNNIAKIFDGKTEPIVDKFGIKGLDSTVNYLERTSELLIATGSFNKAGITESPGISIFRKDSWSKISAPFVEGFHFKRFSPQQYYVAGINASKVLNLFMFNAKNASFNAMNTGINEIRSFKKFEIYNNDLYAVGDFQISIGNFKTGFIQFENSVWKSINANSSARHIDSSNQKLYVVGQNLLSYLSASNANIIGVIEPNQKMIYGNLFLDVNKNCIRDLGDIPISNKSLKFGNDRSPVITDNTGNYFYYFEDNNDKTPTLLLDNKLFSFTLCTKDSINFKNPPNHINGPYDIAVSVSGVQKAVLDTRVIAHGGKNIRQSGRNAVSYLIRNVGLQDATAIKVKLGGSNKMKNIFSLPAYDIDNDSTISWDIPAIPPFGFQIITVSFGIQDNVDVINRALKFDVDYSYNNSVGLESGEDYFSQQITGSDYTVMKEQNTQQNQATNYATIAASDTVIEYQISFQNITSEVVKDVVIIDTLNLLHDFKYTQEIAASHPFTTQVIQDAINPNIGYLVWTFNDISLTANPGQNPEVTSDQGYIKFKFVFNKLNMNEVVKNTALVIMNGNYQYATNSVVCSVNRTVSSKEVTATNENTIYPNPANNKIIIKTATQNYNYQIMDALGKVVLAGTNNAENEIDISALNRGAYFLRLENSPTILRFIKQ